MVFEVIDASSVSKEKKLSLRPMDEVFQQIKKSLRAKYDVCKGKTNGTCEIDIHLCTARGCVPGVSAVSVFAVASVLLAIPSFLLLRRLSLPRISI